ncbi:hypothetical protein HGRIS_003251 [Hohenbuehelia grisea]|uniref:DNA mitochondrial polymerase exonuclease domain-containing protein n=1 Tax=Hohenbuehelia grisea TaxID=104357 RepID=A0ABR3JNH1_9AGAR
MSSSSKISASISDNVQEDQRKYNKTSRHGLDPTQGSLSAAGHGVRLIPSLASTGEFSSNLREHFHRIGVRAAQPWLRLTQEFAVSELPPQPDTWNIQSGWTKYHYAVDGSSYSEHVPFPIHDGKAEEALVLDAEMMPTYHSFAIMGCVVSPNGCMGSRYSSIPRSHLLYESSVVELAEALASGRSNLKSQQYARRPNVVVIRLMAWHAQQKL